MNQTKQADLDFEQYLRNLEQKSQNIDYKEGVSFCLPENPTSIQKIKYDLCKELIIYKRERELNLEKFCNRAKINKELAGEILYYHLDYFSLEQIVEIASNIFNLSIEITQLHNKPFSVHKQQLKI